MAEITVQRCHPFNGVVLNYITPAAGGDLLVQDGQPFREWTQLMLALKNTSGASRRVRLRQRYTHPVLSDLLGYDLAEYTVLAGGALVTARLGVQQEWRTDGILAFYRPQVELTYPDGVTGLSVAVVDPAASYFA